MSNSSIGSGQSGHLYNRKPSTPDLSRREQDPYVYGRTGNKIYQSSSPSNITSRTVESLVCPQPPKGIRDALSLRAQATRGMRPFAPPQPPKGGRTTQQDLVQNTVNISELQDEWEKVRRDIEKTREDIQRAHDQQADITRKRAEFEREKHDWAETKKRVTVRPASPAGSGRTLFEAYFPSKP